MKRKRKGKFEKFAVLFMIFIFIINYFIPLPFVKAGNGESPTAGEEGQKDIIQNATEILNMAKKILGEEDEKVKNLQDKLEEINNLKNTQTQLEERISTLNAKKQPLTISESKELTESQSTLKEIQNKIHKLEGEIRKEVEALKAEIKKHEPPKKKEKKIFQDWVDVIFLGLSLIRALYLADTILTSYGGAGKCSPEQPLKGVDPKICLTCNEDPYRICTRERCLMLGNCIPVPTAKADQYVCVPGKCEELGLPVFDKINVSWFIDGEMKGTTGMLNLDGREINIKLNEGKPIPFNTKMILINLTTYKTSGMCRYIIDKAGANFSEMIDFENNYFPTLPDGTPGWQYAYVLLPGNLSRDATYRIFIKCKNICGIEPEAAYDLNVITFTLDKKPDQLPPEIVYVDPASNSVVRGDLAFINASFWLDEKGSCKFSDKSNNYTINYTQMIPFGPYNNENSSVVNGGCYLGKCLDRNETCSRCWLLLNTSRGYDIINYTGEFNETKLFSLLIRCSDLQGNVMTEDSILGYTLMTAPPYNISIIKPENKSKTYDRQPEIEVVSERATECRYRIYQGSPAEKKQPSWDEMWPIDTEMGTLHKGRHNETLNASRQGILHTIWVRCRDFWHIETIDFAIFYTLLDDDPPVIIRMYRDTTIGDYLIIETNEESECVYGTSDTIKCAYNFSDGSAMTTIDNLLHAAYWQLGSMYYIKCKDKWENYPGNKPNANQCTAIVNPYEVPG